MCQTLAEPAHRSQSSISGALSTPPPDIFKLIRSRTYSSMARSVVTLPTDAETIQTRLNRKAANVSDKTARARLP